MPPPKRNATAAAPSAAAAGSTVLGSSAVAAPASPPDSPVSSIIIHTIDPDHYTHRRKGDAGATASDADDEMEGSSSPRSPDSPIASAADAAAQTKRMMQQLPSPAPPAAAASASHSPSTAIVAVPPVASVTQRAFREAAGGLGGSIFSACCVYPIDLVKTRIQLPNSPYTSLFGGMAMILREEGLSTLYTGLGSELVKASVQSFSYFYWYYVFKEAAVTRLIAQEEAARAALAAASLSTDGSSLTVNPLTRDSSLSKFDLKLHQQACTDPSCFCRSDSHLAAHSEAHRRSGSQIDQWREKALIHRKNKAKQRAAKLQQHQHRHPHPPHDATDFDHNLFHPRMFPSVSEPSLAALGLQKHDLDDSPYVDIKSVENTTLITNTATVLVANDTAAATTAASASPPAISASAVAVVPTPQLSIGMTLLLGTMAGCLTQLVVNPVSVIQTRMMTQKKTVPGGGAALGFFALAAQVFRTEGFGAFFTGILPAFILSTNPSIQFLVFDRLKSLVLRILSQSMVAPRSLSILESFVLGAFSKIVATLVTYPYILAKTRLQLKSTGGGAGGGLVYKGTIDVIARTLKYEGVTGLYSGLQAQLLKSVLGAALMFMAKEKLADLALFLQRRFAALQQPSRSDAPALTDADTAKTGALATIPSAVTQDPKQQNQQQTNEQTKL